MAQPAEHPLERRVSRRVNVGNMVVRVDPCDGREPIMCCIWDLSLEGACLLMPPDVALPDRIRVRFDGELREATVIWRRWSHVGVKFGARVPDRGPVASAS
jgi:hypothetical protein